MVKQSGAESTDLQSPESVDHLCDKCELYAENWEKQQMSYGMKMNVRPNHS